MQDDPDLLKQYAEDRNESAFTELVRRHIGMVYSVALRQVGGNVHFAEDVSQQVFTSLAAKAASLSRHPVISGWLYRTTRYVAIDVVRREDRRRRREKEGFIMNEIHSPPASHSEDSPFDPLLDEAIAELPDCDRDAVTLRFFENRSFSEIGRRLGLTENAARMRVDRILDKLQGLLARRGVTSGSAALAAMLSGQAGVSAPIGLAASVASGALATSASLPAAGTFLTLMATTKIQAGLLATFALIGTGALVFQWNSNQTLARDIAGLRAEQLEIDRLQVENRRLQGIAHEVQSYAGDDQSLAQLQNEALALASRKASPVQVFDISQVDVQPQFVTRPIPAFPAELKRQNVEGAAVVSFVVDPNGNIQDLAVVSSAHPLFGDAAREAVSKWKFTPGAKGGAPVNVKMTVPIVFKISGDAPPSAPPSAPGWFPSS